MAKAKPFLKWAGGKRSLIPQIKQHLPITFNRYYEPFLGGGALFFELCPSNAILSDVNSELINCYIQIKNHPREVIKILKKFRYSKKDYYRIRRSKSRSRIKEVARFIYLNHTCWNGLYRVNRTGKFNVPFGKHRNPAIYDEENLFRVSKVLKKTKIFASDFELAVEQAKAGDFVYMDPPFTVLHGNNSFLEYNKSIFSWEDQKRLARIAKELSQRGCYVMISNAYSTCVKSLYNGFTRKVLNRYSLISGKKEYRTKVHEYIFINYNNAKSKLNQNQYNSVNPLILEVKNV